MRAPAPKEGALRRGSRCRLAFLAAWLLLALASPHASADQNDPRLDGLFAELRETPDAAQGNRVATRIWSIWLESGSGVVDLVMSEGLKAMAVGRYRAALDAFDTAVATAPKFAEAWNKRATVRYLLGDHDGSRQDAEKTLKLEPRHFGAMSGLGLIHSALDEPAEALEWFRRALAVHPHLEEVRASVRRLEEQVEGRAI